MSDIHGNSLAVKNIVQKTFAESVDLVVVCGDITHFGDIIQAKEVLKLLTILNRPLFFVPGNCDSRELVNIQFFIGAENIHGRCRKMDGFNFLGVGGSPPTPFNTPFELSEEEIKNVLYKAYADINSNYRTILVSHAPPIYTRTDLTSSGINAGSRTVREFIEKVKPFLILCGHIHEGKGTDAVGDSLVLNPGSSRSGSYAIVDINGDIRIKL